MAVWIAQNMAPIMFVSLVAFLLLGYPVAFSLGACGLFFFVVGVELAPLSNGALHLAWPMLGLLPERIFDIMNSQTLLAIPFFTLMGLVLQRSGMAEDLLDTVGQLFGTVRGGLAYAVIFVGALLAATTGVVAASVISMGLISLPVMLRYGYDRRVASGIIAASGTLAQIIPPSLVLIVMAEQLQRPVGAMYEAAFVPGLMLAGLYAVFIFFVTRMRPDFAPGLPLTAIGFQEADSTDQALRTRMSGATIGAAAVAIAFAALVALMDFLKSGRPSLGFWALGGLTATVLFLQAGGHFAKTGRDQRGLAPLLALALGAAAFGTGTMDAINARKLAAGSGAYAGADYVVLLLAIDIVCALTIAGVDLVLERTAGRRFLSHLARQVTFVMVPPLFLIFLVLGTIFTGLATPTEAGAMGAAGAIALAAMRRLIDNKAGRFNLALLQSAVEATARLTAFAMFILVGTRIFSLTFFAVGGQHWVEHLLTSLPGGQLGFLIVVNTLVFLLAFFLEFFELAFIVVPLLIAPAEALGVNLVWLGVMLGVNMQTSFLHPPFGYALFYLRSVAPTDPYLDKSTGAMTQGVTTAQIYTGAIPFVLIQCLMVALVIAFPGLTMQQRATAAPPAIAVPLSTAAGK